MAWSRGERALQAILQCRAILGDFVPPIGYIGIYFRTYLVPTNDVINITIDMVIMR